MFEMYSNLNYGCYEYNTIQYNTIQYNTIQYIYFTIKFSHKYRKKEKTKIKHSALSLFVSVYGSEDYEMWFYWENMVGKYLSGGSTYQGEVPIRGKYLSGGSTYQGEVPIRGKYLSGGSRGSNLLL